MKCACRKRPRRWCAWHWAIRIAALLAEVDRAGRRGEGR